MFSYENRKGPYWSLSYPCLGCTSISWAKHSSANLILKRKHPHQDKNALLLSYWHCIFESLKDASSNIFHCKSLWQVTSHCIIVTISSIFIPYRINHFTRSQIHLWRGHLECVVFSDVSSAPLDVTVKVIAHWVFPYSSSFPSYPNAWYGCENAENRTWI